MHDRRKSVLLLTLLMLLASGCAANRYPGAPQGPLPPTILGGIYSHTVQPLTINREATDMRTNGNEGSGHTIRIDIPFNAGLSIWFGKNGLGQVAKEHGLTTIHFADLEQWSALFGLWSVDVVHIYGK